MKMLLGISSNTWRAGIKTPIWRYKLRSVKPKTRVHSHPRVNHTPTQPKQQLNINKITKTQTNLTKQEQVNGQELNNKNQSNKN